MIVPRNRLLYLVAFAMLPAAVIGALYPGASMAGYAAIAVVLAVALSDAVAARFILGGLGVEYPPLLRLGKDREARIAVRILNPGKRARRIRIALVLPYDIQAVEDEMDVALPEGSAAAEVAWVCTPTARGRYQIQMCRVECASPLGLWVARAGLPQACEVRVYPNLLNDRKTLAPVLLKRALGAHARRQVGKGREFEKLREYLPGDSIDDIHWKATAKRLKPIAKVFQLERTQEVYLILDSSRLTARANILERFITTSLVMALATEKQGDLFGLVTFSDRVHTFIRARAGKAHYGACRDALLTLQPQLVTPDFDELAAVLRARLRRRALLIFLTELDDPVIAESFSRAASLLSRQHHLLVNMIRPVEARPLFSRADAANIDDVYQHLGAHLDWEALARLTAFLRQRGVRLSTLDADSFSLETAALYRDVKQRQLV